MTKFSKTYNGGTLRSLLFRYSADRSKVDPVFKAEFDAAQAEYRRFRVAAEKARANLLAVMAAAKAEAA